MDTRSYTEFMKHAQEAAAARIAESYAQAAQYAHEKRRIEQEKSATPAYQPPPASACRHERELALAEELRKQAIADQVTVAHHAFSGGPGYPFFCWCVGCETYRRGWWSRWGQLGAAVAGVVLAAVLGWCMGANDERLRQRREAAPVTTESLPR